MSTRSRIAYTRIDGATVSIYCHSDGYLEGVGKTLFTHYQDPAKIKAMIKLGDMSFLGEDIGEKKSFKAPTCGTPEAAEYCRTSLYYGRDRGDKGVAPKVSLDLYALRQVAEDCDAEFLYVYSGGSWFVQGYEYLSRQWSAMRPLASCPEVQ